VIPIGNRTDRPDYDYSDGVILQVYQLEDGKQVTVEIPALDGTIQTTFEIKREGKNLSIQREGLATEWRVSFAGSPSTRIKHKAGSSEAVIRVPD
ncbi:MAG: alpha-xylosidase, partial [Chloroflexota bacterium]|nr:alpha-xylosidase [Chloroflexota bacterium]